MTEYTLIASAEVLSPDDMRERKLREESTDDDIIFLLRRLDEARAKGQTDG